MGLSGLCVLFLAFWTGLVQGGQTQKANAQLARILPPSSGPALERAFGRIADQVSLKQARIEKDWVSGTFCRTNAEQVCFSFRLSDPLRDCSGELVGPWCLDFPADHPPADLAKALRMALQVESGEQIWKQVQVESPLGETDPAGGSEIIPPAWRVSLARWFLCPGGLAVVAWFLGLAALLGLLVSALLRYKPWRHSGSAFACVQTLFVLFLAFAVRWCLVDPGPGNLYSLLMEPMSPTHNLPLFGPGFRAWSMIWLGLFGLDDSTVFLAGAFTGALTIVPLMVLARSTDSGRWVALAAGLVLALWPIHARLSSTDDPAGLIALLLLSAVTLIELARRLASAELLIGSWLAATLAAAIRPEPALVLGCLALVVVSSPVLRRLQLRPKVAFASGLVLAIGGVLLAGSISAAAANFSPFDSLAPYHLLRLLGMEGGSILVPPQSHWTLSIMVLIGAIAAVRLVGWRALLWLLIGLLPALPTAALARADAVTARYQLALIPFAALFVGLGLTWLSGLLPKVAPRALGWLSVCLAGVIGWVAVWQLFVPPPEPTFRLEYHFFRQHLLQVDPDCKLVQTRWEGDYGLGPPVQLPGMIGSGHQWVRATDYLDPDAECLVYWQAASCRARWLDAEQKAELQPECDRIENGFRLEPIAAGYIPARTGFYETYSLDPVPVGFYRLHDRAEFINPWLDPWRSWP